MTYPLALLLIVGTLCWAQAPIIKKGEQTPVQEAPPTVKKGTTDQPVPTGESPVIKKGSDQTEKPTLSTGKDATTGKPTPKKARKKRAKKSASQTQP